jgi:hypothetical protein
LFSSGQTAARDVVFSLQMQSTQDSIHPALDKIPGQTANHKWQGDVFPHTALRQDHKILKDHCNVATQGVQAAAGQRIEVITGNCGRSSLNGQRSMQEAQECCLARSGGSGQEDEFTRKDIQDKIF